MEHHPASETAAKVGAGGSIMEAIGAIAVIALAIVGLAGVFVPTMTAIATIVLGAAILIEGGALGSTQIVYRTETEFETAERSGMSADFLGGVAGIVLGILALLGVVPSTLTSVALIVFGATFLFSSATSSWAFGAGGYTLVGLAGVVLGILAVIGLSSSVLVLAGLLSLGAAALFSGSTLGYRLASRATAHATTS